MPDWAVEEQSGRRVTLKGETKVETIWQITNTEYEADALSRLLSVSPDVLATSAFSYLLRSDVPEMTELGDGIWEARVIYGTTPQPKEKEWIISGGTRPGRQTVKRAIRIRDASSIHGTSPDWSTAIGVDQQGNVQGFEHDVTHAFFSVETWVAQRAFSYRYQHTVETWCKRGVVNSKKFFGRDPYTTKLTGFSYNGTVEANPEGNPIVRLRYDFEVGENFIYDPVKEAAYAASYPLADPLLTGVRIEGIEHPLTMMAWDYLDVQEVTTEVESIERPADAEDAKPGETHTPTKWIIKQPIKAKVCVVMHELDFGKLGIGIG